MKPKFTFKITDGNLYEYDTRGNEIHYKSSNDYERWKEYDANGNVIHFKDSDGIEYWYNAKGKRITKKQFDAIHAPKPSCAGKVVEIDGKKYKLVEA